VVLVSVVAIVIAVLASFPPLMTAARRGSSLALGLGRVEALLFVAGTGFVVLAASYYAIAECDEACDTRSGWWHSTGAWQWQVQLALALLALASALITVLFTVRRRCELALACALLGLVLFVTWAAMLSPLWDHFGL
jgi:hypothetical protein